jgi:DNA mismatch repair protein MSH5
MIGILNNTKTVLGRNLLRQWLLRPALSIPVINSRHDAIACFLHPDNISTADLLHQYLAKIKNVPRILSAMKSGKSNVKDWQGLLVVRTEFSSLDYNCEACASFHSMQL